MRRSVRSGGQRSVGWATALPLPTRQSRRIEYLSRGQRRATPCIHVDVRFAPLPTLRLIVLVLLERPFTIAQPRQQALLLQGVELERDLAAIRAAERLHDLIKIHRPGPQRVARAVAPPLPVEARRPRASGLDRIRHAVAGGQVE